MQSRKHSMMEAMANTASGFLVSWIAGLFVYPLFGADFSMSQITGVTVIFTVISVARNYVWRRLFNRYTKTADRKGIDKVAEV